MSRALRAPAAIASPCINVCKMDEMSGLCRGCFRTLEEITGWSRAADDDKLTILAAVDRRRAEHGPCGDNFRGESHVDSPVDIER